MKAVVAAFNQEKALVGAFSVITNLRMELFEALFQVVWNEEKQRLEVTIRPVDTQLFDVHVAGCRPPWYLW